VGKRRKAREILLQALYAAAVGGGTLARALDDQLSRREGADETETFARALAAKAEAHLAGTDRWLAGLLEHWDPERLGQVERAILRLALTELAWSPDVPQAVVINEACELARRYSDEQAVPFVNGILDRAAAQVLAGDPAAPAPGREEGGA